MKSLKRVLASGIVMVLLIWMMAGTALADVNAKGAVVLEMTTGRVLYAQDSHRQLPMASTTKVMTALLAVENGDLSEVVTVADQASGVEGSSIYLARGEHITLEELLYGLMMHSGNDAAEAIAYHLAGSIEAFAQMMNERAQALGLTDTHFANPHGLPAEDHYTTAYDLAAIAAAAMKNPQFAAIVGTLKKTISYEGHDEPRYLRNSNKMLTQYEGANGIKTGYTKAAGRCLVTGALRDDMQLVSVVLNAPDMYNASAWLLDYGFDHYKMTTVACKGDVLGSAKVSGGVALEVPVCLTEDIKVPLAEGEEGNISLKSQIKENLQAPVAHGDVLGTVDVYLGDEKLCTKEIQAGADVEKTTVQYYFLKVIQDWLNGIWGGAAA